MVIGVLVIGVLVISVVVIGVVVICGVVIGLPAVAWAKGGISLHVENLAKVWRIGGELVYLFSKYKPMGTRSFLDLEVYQTSRRLRIKVAGLVESAFPEIEKYKLSDQIIRSSRRITACLAEGYGRYYFKENIRFCRMARG